MSTAGKYLQVAKINWKSLLAYQADAWLGAAVSGFRVLLSLLATLLSRLQHQDAMAWIV